MCAYVKLRTRLAPLLKTFRSCALVWLSILSYSRCHTTDVSKIGPRAIESTLINPAIMESVKAITALYTAEELVTSRAEVKNNIQGAIEVINTTLSERRCWRFDPRERGDNRFRLFSGV